MSNVLLEQLLRLTIRRHALDQGAYLFHRDDPVEWMFVIEEGRVELVRPQPDGNPITLQRAGQNTVLAEASLYSVAYHCDGIASLPSVAAAISKQAVLARLRSDAEFSRLWAEHLAKEMQKSRYRSEIMSRRTVAERLDAWLDLHDGAMQPKGEWKAVAAEIGVSPEAFYRELSKRR